ncbi:MAG: DNA repair protein RecO [Candidatus Binatia bacterium]|nr:DNA repair protein RecO [Candidatus Binatia bacterium]
MATSVAHEAIILRVRAYGESDKIVTFLTDAAGKFTGIAKGAKNSRRRFPNCLDPLARVRMHYRPRPGPGLVFLERCDLRRPATAYGELPRLAYGQYLVELVDSLTEEAHGVPEMFQLLDQALELLLAGPATSPFLRAFEMQLLHHAGYSPQLSFCGRCRRPLRDAADAILDLQHSSALCVQCSPGPENPTLVRLSGQTLSILENLKLLPLGAAQTLQWEARIQSDAALALSGLLAPHLRRPLRSLRVLHQLAHS